MSSWVQFLCNDNMFSVDSNARFLNFDLFFDYITHRN